MPNELLRKSMKEGSTDKEIIVSIIMPSYNQADYLPKAIESVITQSFRDFELIIIDDCSEDDSKLIAKRYSLIDNRVKLISHSKNMGRSQSRNDGIEAARGRYIAFIDSDDEWKSHKLERQLSEIELNSAVIYSNAELIDHNSKYIGKLFSEMINLDTFHANGNIFNDLINSNFVCHQSILVPKKYIDELRFDSSLKYIQDYDLNISLSASFLFKYIDEPLTKYRLHGKNSIYQDKKGWANDNIILRKKILFQYDNRLSDKQKAFNLFEIALSYFALREFSKSITYIWKGFMKDATAAIYVLKLLINSRLAAKIS